VGRIGFVRRFVHDFSIMVKHIHNMMKHDQSFSWMEDVKKDFVRIKKVINSAQVLAKPDFNKEFIIYMKSTEESISIVLLQKHY